MRATEPAFSGSATRCRSRVLPRDVERVRTRATSRVAPRSAARALLVESSGKPREINGFRIGVAGHPYKAFSHRSARNQVTDICVLAERIGDRQVPSI